MLNFTTPARGTLTAIAWLLACCLLTPTAAAAAEYYVAPNGSSTNDGSVSRPLDLATALSASSPARPGDTIWLRDGRYLGTFVSDLEGSTTAPIVVRQYPGERAVIDAVTGNRNTPALYVRGSDTWYWGFEVTDSNPVRKVTGGYNPPRATSVWVLGPRTKFINMIVHDGEQGFGFWNPAVDAELYGNLIYNVGFDSDDRGHGHSIYVQNTSGTKRIVDNILFNGFSFGIHAYTEGGRIDNVHMKGNTIFNHGVLSAASGAKANLYMGGGDDPDFPVIQDNYLYYSPFESAGRNIDLRPSCNSGTVTGNYAAGGTAVSLYCVGTSVTGNVFAGEAFLDSAYPSNTYTATKPTAPKVFVRPNTYEPGARANITVFNWDRQPYVLVNLSAAGLPVGAEFEIRDAQNYFGNPVVSGVYTGASVLIPMTGLTVDPPVGQIPIKPTHTAPEFGAFILVRSSGTVASNGPTATFTGSPGSIAAGQSATLSWSTGNATSVVINQGIGAVPTTGSRTVTPSTTTTYTLTATNASGTVSRAVTIQVQNAPPKVSVSASGTSFTPPAAITLTAIASDPGGSVKHVKFYAGSTELATDSTAPYSYLWTNVVAGTYVVTARATDNLGATTTSAAFNLTVGGGSTTPPPSAASASFVRLDTTTQGSWKGVYGAEGYSIAQDQTLLPSYAKVTRAGATGWTWSASTSDVRAVQRATGTGRLAATWFGSSFTIDVTITDGQRHQVALYLLDWDRNNRSETVDVLDAATNAVLHRIAVSSFSGGKYAVWQITGNVRFKITRTGGANAAVSGIFFGGGTGQTVPPTVGAASATFLRTDTTTHGNWKGMYGAEGYSLAQAETSKPNYANLTIPGGLPHTWSASESDTRALQRASGTDRLAAAWFNSSFAVDVAMTDGQSHQIALYFLDWDHNNRAETIEVLDAATNAVLDTRVVSSFDGGQYFVWLAKGHLRFRITGKNGANAVVSGVFFGGG